MPSPPSSPNTSAATRADPLPDCVIILPWCYSPASMEAATWTAIALLAATSVGSLFYLGSRIDALAARLDARIDAVSTDLGSRLDAQGASLGARIEAQSVSLGSRIDAQGAKIDAQSARIDGLTAKMDEHLRRHAG